jgi:hypothetical protein
VRDEFSIEKEAAAINEVYETIWGHA